MTSLCTLPKEIIRSILLKLTPAELTNKINLVNQQFHGQVTQEAFWKEVCLCRYYIPSSGLSKPAKQTWQKHAFELENAPTWAHCSPQLQITNKSYTISYPPSSSPSSSPPPSLFLGVASKPMVAGPFIGRYFEIVVNSLPAGDDVVQLVVGLAPYNILQNPQWEKINGYTNTGTSNYGVVGKPYGVGDRVGVLLNTEYMTVSFLKNDVLQGTPYVHLDKHIPWHPVVGILREGVSVTIPLPPLKEPPLMPLR